MSPTTFGYSTKPVPTPNWAIFDAAQIPAGIERVKEAVPGFLCLYKGKTAEKLAAVAPYLVDFSEGSGARPFYRREGMGKALGILFTSGSALEDLQRHFRKFVFVRTEDGTELYFRFYDPRVLGVFLPSCSEAQLEDFFGPVDHFFVENETGSGWIQFSQEDGRLSSANIQLKLGQ